MNFIVEFIMPEESLMSKSELWTVQTDGSSTKGRSGVGVIITSPEGDILKYGVQLQFPATNNEAEYEAILTGLRIAKSMEAKNILLKSDSKLVIRQIKGDYKAKEQRMQKYLKLTNQLARDIEQVEFAQVPRSLNAEANEVARQASSDAKDEPLGIRLGVQKFPGIEEFHTFAIQGNTSWMTPIMSYLKDS